jgi:hypothetical protein
MGKIHTAVKLWIARKPLFHSRHPDQNDANTSAVKYVPDEFERSLTGARFIDDQYFNVKLVARYDPMVHLP